MNKIKNTCVIINTINCICGSIINNTKKCINIHNKTSKHQNFINNNNTKKELSDEEKKEKEKRAEIDKKIYEKNKEKLNKKRSEKIKCECGCEIARRNLYSHKKTKKHILAMEEINNKQD